MRRLIFALPLLALATPALAQISISALPSATTPTGAEVIPIVQSSTTKKATVSQIVAGGNAAAKQTFPAATSSAASVNLPHGTAPTSPVNGDMWTTSGGLYAQVNGATRAVRPMQIGATTLYVRTDGNDACDGSADAAYSTGVSTCAFASWQAATNAARRLDTGLFDVTIKAGAESGVKTWNLSSSINVLGPAAGTGAIHYEGNCANTVLSNASGSAFFVDGWSRVYLGCISIASGGGYGSVNVASGWVGLETTGPIFGPATGAQIYVHDNKGYFAALASTFTLTGGAQSFISVNSGASSAIEGNTVTLQGSPAYPWGFAFAGSGAYLQASGNCQHRDKNGPRTGLKWGQLV